MWLRLEGKPSREAACWASQPGPICQQPSAGAETLNVLKLGPD